MPEPIPFDSASQQVTAINHHCGLANHVEAPSTTNPMPSPTSAGTPLAARPNLSIIQPLVKNSAKSMAPPIPITTEIAPGSSPTACPHSGSTTWRADRSMVSAPAPMPSVSNTSRRRTIVGQSRSCDATLTCLRAAGRPAVFSTSGSTSNVTTTSAEQTMNAQKFTCGDWVWLIIHAETNGPTNAPERNTPPSDDIARARTRSGTYDVRNDCRASANTAVINPCSNTPTSSIQGVVAFTEMSAPAIVPSAASVIESRSPSRATRDAAGRLPMAWPINSDPAMNPAKATSAPRDAAIDGMTGTIAPCPIE